MTVSLGNRAKMSTSTTGTGTITLGSAVSGFQTFADAGITNGQTVRYAIDDGANFEIGSGTYTSSGTTLTRSVTESSNSDSAISLSGSAEVFIAATVADLNPLYAANESSPSAQPSATGTNAVAIGDSAAGSGTNSIALEKSRASGTRSFAVQNNSTAYGATGTGSVAIGNAAYSTGSNSVAIGQGTNATSTGSICIGQSSSASAPGSIAFGNNVYLQGTGSVGFGKDAYDNDIDGKFAFGRDPLSNQRDVGGGLFVLGCSTTDATATTLTTYSTTPTATNQITLKNKAALVFNGLIVGRQDFTDGTDTAAFKVQGIIRREANAGTTVLVNSTVDTIQKTVSTMACTVSADTTLGCVKIQVTGIAGHNIRWAGNISTAEIEYT
jgi:hypothetical protein